MSDEPAALVTREGSVSIITLNRPEVLNAVNSALATIVGQALSAAGQDPDISVVVITGSGRAFCAGADLKELAKGNSLDVPGHPEWGFAGMVQQWISKPVIAAVNGLAVGGGAEILLSCDLAVADASVMIGLPETRRGLVATGGGVLRLHRQIPLKIALEMALTGEPISAEMAANWGLINHISAPGKTLEMALQIAQKIASNAPFAVQATKRLIHRGSLENDIWDSRYWTLNNAEHSKLLQSEEAREGALAFAEHRKPSWKKR